MKFRLQLFDSLLIGRASSSIVVLIFLILIGVDSLLMNLKPLQNLHNLNFIPRDQHPLLIKLPAYLNSREQTNLLILGSSLPMCAIGLYDQKCFGEPKVNEALGLRGYLGAKYLEQELGKKKGFVVNAVNLSITACMASDMYVILEKSIAAHKRPDSVLLCIAPRDFVDNTAWSIGRTPSFECLQDWKSLKEVFQSGSNIAEVRDFFIARLWYFYRVKVDYRTLVTEYCTNFLRHPRDFFSWLLPVTRIKQVVRPASKQPMEAPNYDLIYESRYKPPNFRRFELEREFFEKLLSLCFEERIQCVVVNMPVSASHNAILDEKLNQLYLADGKGLCEKYNARYLDYNDKEFSNQDFSDGFHLNAIGSEKFQKRLLMDLIKEDLFENHALGH